MGNLNSPVEKFYTLVNWIRDNGGFVSDSLCISKDGGIVSTSPIEKNERFLRVTERIMMGMNETYVNEKWDTRKISAGTIHVVILLAEKEKGDSFYNPYINMLPPMETFDSHPIIQKMKTETCDFLVTPIWNLCSEMLKTIRSEFSIVSSLNEESTILHNLTFELFLWGYMIYLTRAHPEYGFIPLVDLFDHSNDSQYLENYSLSASKNIKTGDIIYSNYNETNPWKMVSYRGFLSDKFSHNVCIPLEITDVSTSLKQYELSITTSMNVLPHDVYFNEKGPSRSMMDILRVLNWKEYDVILASAGYFNPLTFDNEISTMKNMLKILYKYSKTHKLSDKHGISEKMENSKSLLVKYAATITMSEYNLMEKCYEKILTDWELQILPETMKPNVVNTSELYSC